MVPRSKVLHYLWAPVHDAMPCTVDSIGGDTTCIVCSDTRIHTREAPVPEIGDSVMSELTAHENQNFLGIAKPVIGGPS